MRNLSPTEQTIVEVVAAADRRKVTVDDDDVEVLVMEQRSRTHRQKGRESWRRRIGQVILRLEREGILMYCADDNCNGLHVGMIERKRP